MAKNAKIDWRKQLTAQLVADIEAQCSAEEAVSIKHFIRLYFTQYPTEDVRNWNTQDVCGYVLGLWRFLASASSTPKIALFNASMEDNGWVSTHTELWILQKDMAFLQNSVRLALDSIGIRIVSIYSRPLLVERNTAGELLCLEDYVSDKCDTNMNVEALLCLQIGRHSAPEQIKAVRSVVQSVLKDVALCADDYPAMRTRLQEARAQLQPVAKKSHGKESEEAQLFLDWLQDGHFIFMGYRYVSVENCEKLSTDKEPSLSEKNTCRLGLFTQHGYKAFANPPQPNRGFCEFFQSNALVGFSKSRQRSRIHRSTYYDYVIIKALNNKGVVEGEHCFIGLYTAQAYNQLPNDIPLLRKKFAAVFERTHLHMSSHHGKAIMQIMISFPRDEWFLASIEDLTATAIGVLQIQERRKVRLFVQGDGCQRFVSCLVYVPRDIYNTDLCKKIESILCEEFGADESSVNTYFSASVLACAYFVLKLRADAPSFVDVDAVELRVIEAATAWEDYFSVAAIEHFGEEIANRLLPEYADAFPSAYKETFSARQGACDVQHCEAVVAGGDIALALYQRRRPVSDTMFFKVFHAETALPLSSVMPLLENMGVRVIGEQMYPIKRKNGPVVWLHDFELQADALSNIAPHKFRERFQDTIAAVWRKQAESDRFNTLVLLADIPWRDVVMLRALARYMKQIGMVLSLDYIAETLSRYPAATVLLVDYFHTLFDPDLALDDAARSDACQSIQAQTKVLIDTVDNFNEDHILRSYVELIEALLRTNFYQVDAAGNLKLHVSFKFAPEKISALPKPCPYFEIFVYAPRIEGVHLRFGTVARGGLRWSDRLEDFRKEVLGLVKAQQVKNSVIVPVGAKGCFVLRHAQEFSDRESLMEEGRACYRTFIRGMLDLTDNRVKGHVVPPVRVLRRDGDDPYLVVAADKGTATFSDIANAIAEEYGFWLGDAFASGGSVGYDHKKMGITAKGAWIAVQRHFRERGIDVQQQSFSCIGIGDMSGDVFGNGLLLSKHTCLLAAFDHRHIFIDPAPDAEKSFVERERLFALPRSSWADYSEKLISKGGGIFSRTAKLISISPEIKAAFDVSEDKLTPNELITRLLRARVDLLWNGGIGVYVKSTEETDADVGDKSNDGIRINGSDLRCLVVGEGGNLGMTQRGRIEYCLNGGACNTDFIDNAGGVDCSDHEVNLKILFRDIAEAGDITQKQRNQMLLGMTDEVSALVLMNNYRQVQAISLAEQQSLRRSNEYLRYIAALEHEGRLNRQLENLPADDVLLARKQAGVGLTRPELSMLISYAKMQLKEELAASSVAEDAYMAKTAETAFPQAMMEKYGDKVPSLHLYKQIVATQLAGDIVNHMGFSFAYRLRVSTNAEYGDIASAYVTARDSFALPLYWRQIEALDGKVDAQLQLQMMAALMHTIRRATRWFLRNRHGLLDVVSNVENCSVKLAVLAANMSHLIGDESWDVSVNHYVQRGIPHKLAVYCASATPLYYGLGIIEVAKTTDCDVVRVAGIYFELGRVLHLSTFLSQLNSLRVDSHWQALAREAFFDDVEYQQRSLTVLIVRGFSKVETAQAAVHEWLEQFRHLLLHWEMILAGVGSAVVSDYAIYSVALRELSDMVRQASDAAA